MLGGEQAGAEALGPGGLDGHDGVMMEDMLAELWSIDDQAKLHKLNSSDFIEAQ